MITKEQLEEYQKAYAQGNQVISDEEYDALLEEYLQNNGGETNRPFNRNKQSSEVNDIVGTLPKVYGTTEPMRPGMKTYQMWVEDKNINGDIILQPKFDGCSIAVDFNTQRWFTRGDYDDGESVDVTDVFKDHFNKIKWFAEPGTQAMKFEAILSHEVYRYEDYQIYKKYQNRPRDYVAATITSRSSEMAKLITLVPLRAYIDGRQYIPKALADISIKLSS
jgi:NAD-dependent DNA ligase